MILGAVALITPSPHGQEMTDAELLAMGRDGGSRNYLAASPADYDALRTAEERFSLALAPPALPRPRQAARVWRFGQADPPDAQ